VSAIVAVAKGSDDAASFCALASRYMECIKTYTRGCLGFYFGEGTLTELQNIAQYCCSGITSTKECPFNPNVQRTCIDAEADAIMADGSLKKVKNLEIGDKVKTLDSNGKLTETDVIMMMDISEEDFLFFNIKTYSNKNIRVSGSHLMAIENGRYKFAKNLNRDETIITFDFEKQVKIEEKIESILIEEVDGYAAPLTMSGNLLVNGILTSSYAVIDSHDLAHAVMSPVRWWYTLANTLAHSLPQTLSSSIQIEKQMNGTHWFPSILHSVTNNYFGKVVPLH